jgi:pSer/pThr/pTyr-binding forkhead associated (FHA) protein
VARLLVRAGTEPGREYALPESGEIRIGRLPGLPITLLDTKVSREHCRVYRQSTGWIAEDLGSRNGTYVNAQRVKKRLLQPGDRLRVGQTEFEYSPAAAGAPDAAASAPAPAPAPALRASKRPPR